LHSTTKKILLNTSFNLNYFEFVYIIVVVLGEENKWHRLQQRQEETGLEKGISLAINPVCCFDLTFWNSYFDALMHSFIHYEDL